MASVNKQRQLSEILKCGRSPTYFINEYCKIQHPQQGLIQFKTYNFQNDCIDAFVKHRFNIVLKSRQLGLSTVTAAYAAWLALFHKEKNILVIATKLKTAINFIKKVKIILNNLPDWMQITSFETTTQEIRFKNGSLIQAIPTSEDAGRSEALSLLIVDEAAFIRNFEDIWTGIYPCLSTGGAAIILSTPNGVGGQYYKLYSDAESKRNMFNPIKLLWNVHPEHDQAWYNNEIKNLSKRKAAQELLCEFVGSGDTFLQPDDIEWMQSLVREPLCKGSDQCAPEDRGVERDVWIWSLPMYGHKYIVSADVARGDGKDYSTFHILDATNGEIAAEYMGKIPPDKLGILIDKYGRKYNNAIACPENNSFGYMTCAKLKELKYPKMFYEKAKSGAIETYVPANDELPGFTTQTKSRDLALTKLEEVIRNRVIRSYSIRLLNEFRTFIWVGARASAMKDEHDDLVMSSAIASWLFDLMFGKTVGDSTDAKAFLKAMSKTSTKIASVPGAGYEVRPIFKKQMLQNNRPGTVKTGDDLDFSWLTR